MRETILAPEVVDEIVEKSLASVGQLKIAKDMQVSIRQVRKVLASPEYKSKLREIVEQDVEAARNRMRIKIAKAETEILEAFFSLLRDGGEKSRIEAVKIGLRVLDVDKTEERDTQGQLIIQLPGQRPETVIEVQKESTDDTI